ncbi:MAG: LysR family transcriptional regulator [Desulfobacteraceae bacterium]|nr:LysR family transcriptional regulator [Desulfobacteraceae bacterium]
MNINLLRIFYYAAKLGSISAAAEALFVTQPAVSKGLQRLQEHYEIKFINLFGRKISLTDAGEVLYSIAEKIFEIEKQAEELIHDFQERKRGNIRILSSESFGAYYLPFIIIPYRNENPQVHISASILPTELVVEGTAALNCDIGFISYPIEHNKLIVREVLEDRMVVIVPATHPLAGKESIEPLDLEGESIILHEKGSAPQRIVDDLIGRYHLSIDIPLELSSNEAIKRAVAGGLGISIISRNVAGEEIKSGQLVAVPFSLGSMRRKFFMVHHKDKYFSEALQNFIDMVYQWADEYAKSIY